MRTGSNFNRYWYADDNPYRFIDPDGRYSCPKENCGAVKGFVNRITEARGKHRFGSATYRRLNRVAIALGSEGTGGPVIADGRLKSGTLANWDPRSGTITMDFKQIAGKNDSVQKGAQALGHEVQHDLWKTDNEGRIPSTESDVRESEEDAYTTSRAIDESMGLEWTEEDFNDAVQDSVDNWKSKQEEEDQK